MPTKNKADLFQGFPKSALTFFRQLAKNNDRDWFTPRKELYQESCVAPMVALVGELNERLRKSAVQYVAPEPKKAIYRIYRDTRFSKDKTPYKTHIAALFQRSGYARNHGPGFYFQVSPEYVGVGGGVYMPEPEELKAIREGIVKDPAGYAKAMAGKKLKSLFGEIMGESAKRLPKGFETVAPKLAAEVCRKQFFFWAEIPAKAALDRKLVGTLTTHLEALVAPCEWLHRALSAGMVDEDHRPKRPEPMF